MGERISIAYTRAIVRAALSGALDSVDTQKDPYFGLEVPCSCPGVPDSLLNPIDTWDSKEEYGEKAAELCARFKENFSQLGGEIPKGVRSAGPAIEGETFNRRKADRDRRTSARSRRGSDY